LTAKASLVITFPKNDFGLKGTNDTISATKIAVLTATGLIINPLFENKN
jgi:hypothetical protein